MTRGEHECHLSADQLGPQGDHQGPDTGVTAGARHRLVHAQGHYSDLSLDTRAHVLVSGHQHSLVRRM